MLFVELFADDGLRGLGETCLGAEAVEAYIHETVAPYLLGRRPEPIDEIWSDLRGYLGFDSTSVETRGNSAIDIALWDLAGRAQDKPLAALLGPRVRASIPIYNTCAGYEYARSGGQLEPAPSGLGPRRETGPYDDLDAFLNRADKLAESLLRDDVRGMKIWPFDRAARRSGGRQISSADLERGLEPIRKIRRAVGKEMDVMIELHALWDLPSAKVIAGALEEFEPRWLEDPIKADDLTGLATLAEETTIPIGASETLAGISAFRELFERGVVGVPIFDIGWAGGLTAAKQIAELAESHGLPVAPHDCTGPVVLTASTHFGVTAPNALIQETVRSFYYGWYAEILTELPRISEGTIEPPTGAGLGTHLKPTVWARSDAKIRTSRLGDAYE